MIARASTRSTALSSGPLCSLATPAPCAASPPRPPRQYNPFHQNECIRHQIVRKHMIVAKVNIVAIDTYL
jgi:hypothetical protein